MASAANQTSGTRLPEAESDWHRPVKICQWREPGVITRQLGCSRICRAKSSAGRNRTRWREYAWMGHDSEETAQHKVAYAVGLATLKDSLQPLTVTRVIQGIFPVGIDQHVDVGQDHAPCSITESKEAELFRSIPGRTPSPPTVARRSNGCGATGSVGAILSRSVSSMRCDRSQPFSRASLVAWASRASSSWIVVCILKDYRKASRLSKHRLLLLRRIIKCALHQFTGWRARKIVRRCRPLCPPSCCHRPAKHQDWSMIASSGFIRPDW